MKQYNDEKAIISLTSWTKRINTCHITINSLLEKCPGFHIVLVLSEEEFPNKENELSNELKSLIDSNMIELLWVYKNYKSYKKILFTMDKYKTVPIICADDGCIYNQNYADVLYNEWLMNKNKIFCNNLKFGAQSGGVGAYGIIYPPNCYNHIAIDILNKEYNVLITNSNDDRFLANVSYFLKHEYAQTQLYAVKRDNIFTDLRNNNAMHHLGAYVGGNNMFFYEIVKKYFLN